MTKERNWREAKPKESWERFGPGDVFNVQHDVLTHDESEWETDGIRVVATCRDPQDAAEIVRRWNCHDDLLEALKEFVHPYQSGTLTERELREKALAAITKAEGRVREGEHE